MTCQRFSAGVDVAGPMPHTWMMVSSVLAPSGQVMDLDPDAMVWRRDRGRNPGGPLYDDGVHKYATAAYWIGEIGDISAIVTHGGDIIMETPAAAMGRFKGRDCLGIVDYTYAPEMTIRSRYYRADDFFEIHGSRGIIWVTRCTGEMLDLPPVVVTRGAETVSHQVGTDWRRRGGGLRRRADRRPTAAAGRPRGEANPPGAAGDLRSRAHRARRRAGIDRVDGSRGKNYAE